MTRTRRLAWGLAVGAMVAATSHGDDGALMPPHTPFLETVQVNVVNVEVYVTDKDGKVATGLAAKDFVVQEDGRKVALSHFAWVDAAPEDSAGEAPASVAERPPHYVAFFLDDVTIDAPRRRLALEALRGFVHRDRDSDVAYAVAVYDGTLEMLQSFTYDRDLVLAALRGSSSPSPLGILRQQQREAVEREGLELLRGIRQLTNSPIRDTEVARYLTDVSRQIDVYASRVEELNGLSFYALSHFANSLAALPGRKSVIYVSNGLPARPGQELYQAVRETLRIAQRGSVNQSDSEAVDADIRARSSSLSAIEAGRGRRPERDDVAPSENLRTLTALANASGVSFYTYKGQGNVGGVEPEFGGGAAELLTPQFKGLREDNLAETLHVMAAETGGAAVVGGTLESLVEHAKGDFAGYYSLGYQPTHAGDGKFHSIKVKVRGRGLAVRHRRGYVDKPAAVKTADRTSTALLLGLDDNPLGLMLEFGIARPTGQSDQWKVPIRLTVPLSALALRPEGTLLAAEAQLYIAAHSATGDIAPVQEATLRIEVPAASLDTEGAASHTTEFELVMRRGAQRLAIGFVDPVALQSSFLSRNLDVGSN